MVVTHSPQVTSKGHAHYLVQKNINNNQTYTNIIELNENEKIEEIVKPFGLANEHYDQTIGLGLNYVQSALEILNATLKIVSNKDKTVFTIGFNL